MVSEVKVLPPLLIHGDADVAESWKLWVQRFKIYLNTLDHVEAKDELAVKKIETKKVALFLHLIGEECLQIFNSFNLTSKLDNCSLSLTEVIAKFEEHFIPKKKSYFCETQIFHKISKRR